MITIATIFLATSLANGTVPLKYEHKPYKLEQMEIFLRDEHIYDLDKIPVGFVAKQAWGYKKDDRRSEQQKRIDQLYTQQIRDMAINNFDFKRSGLSKREAGTMYGEKVGKAVFETKYTLKPLDVYVIYGLPASVLHND
ncbi:hypothetical protein TUM3794_20770 [Shewanella colwelliana]|uniref:Uncharacterized protein n=1 Tax=Shewanella colwelliana TaxID=23 RepID=A0ABQ4P0R5_SHECO|nr:hypothetical protein [Shewanella colwelliana]GIU41096.1 hypothetical protein TUM3794_20770 [Shewanella colwelliana]